MWLMRKTATAIGYKNLLVTLRGNAKCAMMNEKLPDLRKAQMPARMISAFARKNAPSDE